MDEEKIYTVKEIAARLSTSEETVRRWIRDGKLKAYHSSRKEGNQITESALEDFFSQNEKYKRLAARAAMMSSAAVLPVGLPLGIASAVQGKKQEAEIDRAREAYEKGKAEPSQETPEGGDLQASARALLNNAGRELEQIRGKLNEAMEKRQALDREIAHLKQLEQMSARTFELAQQTWMNISHQTMTGPEKVDGKEQNHDEF